MNYLSFLPIAQAVASMSKDPSTQVGAVLLDRDFNILATGFNGFPRGVPDLAEDYANREIKLSLVAHAEANAIAQAARVGARLLGSTMVVTALHPCANCAKLIIQSGIRRVYAPHSKPLSKWNNEENTATYMFSKAGIEVIRYEL